MTIRSKKPLIIAAVVIVVFILGSFLLAELGNLMDPGGIPIGPEDDTENIAAPDFTVYDSEGNAFLLSSVLGQKPVVISFWASWHEPCHEQLDAFASVYPQYKDDVVFVMISAIDNEKETLQSASDFALAKAYPFETYTDKDQSAILAYGVRSVPTTYFINSQGLVKLGAQDPIDEATIRQGMAAIL